MISIATPSHVCPLPSPSMSRRGRPPSSTPIAAPSPAPPSVGQAMPPHAGSPKLAPSRSSQRARAPSPNYFGLVVDSSRDPANSSQVQGANAWDGTPHTVVSVAATSPQKVSADASSDFETFRRQSEGRRFNLAHPALSQLAEAGAKQSPSADGVRPQRGLNEPVHRLRPVRGQPSEFNQMAGDPMDVDMQGPALQTRQGAVSSPTQPLHESPAALGPGEANPTARIHLSDARSRLSLPARAAASTDVGSHRALTLPVVSDPNASSMMSPQDLVALLQDAADDTLLLDLRVNPQFAQARIRSALNLCIPTTLLKRPSFNLQKLADTFTKIEDKRAFERWTRVKHIVVYDDRSSSPKEATACFHAVKKFTNEGWRGEARVLTGGFASFSRRFPQLVDRSTQLQSPPSSPPWSSDGTQKPGVAPVAGGCPLPSAQSAANPFFGNIRQNMDLIGGVGQLCIKRPPGMTDASRARLPEWLLRAMDERDAGKAVSERFLQIERTEQRRMQDALSGVVSYGADGANKSKVVQIAGIEKGGKNRYNNIWPYDHARVKLQELSDGACDYINASHVKAAWSNKRYIATQGPLPATFRDFWSLVWEQDVRAIVMLTAEQEGGQLKCHAYWQGSEFGPLRLKALSEKRVSLDYSKLGRRKSSSPAGAGGGGGILSPKSADEVPHVIVRKFSLTHSAHPFTPMREITQLQYSMWPDFDVPANPAHILGLIEHCDVVVRASLPSSLNHHRGQPFPPDQRPLLVHCSAGCGRTGTFCTIDSALDMLRRQRAEVARRGRAKPGDRRSQASGTDRNDDDDHDDWVGHTQLDLIAKTVEDFRDQRLSMVQTLRQFVLCYEAVLAWLVEQQTPPARSGPTSPT